MPFPPDRVSRRSFIKVGSSAAAGALALGAVETQHASAASPCNADSDLPVDRIQSTVGAEGTTNNGVFSIEVDRDDIDHVVNGSGTPIKPSFEVNGNLYFQSMGDRSRHAILNGDLAFLPSEIQPATDQMSKHGLTLQALHQHFYDWSPLVWFMHFRGRGDAVSLARGVRSVLDATATPLPQQSPSNPTSPLDAKRLARIIGADPTVGADGVVSFDVPRRERLTLDGDRINPHLNVATTVSFEPLGDRTAVVPDFGMLAGEVERLIAHMRGLGWQVGCLYNQETAEQPQLYFSHQFKRGDAYQLANEVRSGLDLLNVDTSR